jgi:hypothetical protein
MIRASNLDKNFFVYYDGGIENDMLDGNGEVWLFCVDKSAYYWEGEFADGYPVKERCTGTNIPYGSNLLVDLDLYLKDWLNNPKRMFSKEFNHRNDFIIPLLAKRDAIKLQEPVLVPFYHHLRSAANSHSCEIAPSTPPTTPPCFPVEIDTPERITSYAKQRCRLSSVAST